MLHTNEKKIMSPESKELHNKFATKIHINTTSIMLFSCNDL